MNKDLWLLPLLIAAVYVIVWAVAEIIAYVIPVGFLILGLILIATLALAVVVWRAWKTLKPPDRKDQ